MEATHVILYHTNMNTNDLKSKLNKCLEHLKIELSQVRTGRATPALVENVYVDVYGTKMSLRELGSISLLDPQNLLVSPWDKGLVKDIARTVGESGLGLNPVVDGQTVRIPVPALTEERRKELTKMVSAKVEDCKNSMRNVRQEAMKEIERDFSEKRLSEDEKFAQKDQVEKFVKEYTTLADQSGEHKKADLLKV